MPRSSRSRTPSEVEYIREGTSRRRYRGRLRFSRDRSLSRSRRDRSRSYLRSDRRRSRSRSRNDDKHRSRDRSRSRTPEPHRVRNRSRTYTNCDSSIRGALSSIMSRLSAIEASNFKRSRCVSSLRGQTPPVEDKTTTAQTLAGVLTSLSKGRSGNYYVSKFDPAINNFEVWCDEVDRAKQANQWDDLECFSRVAYCLTGDAKTWLGEWSTNDRSWSNFVKEFKSLCSQKINYAQMLHDVINTKSDRFLSYAEYARRSLLKLRAINGLSGELMVQIVVYGISDVQVQAAATNADLTTDNLVSFLATYVKPTQSCVNRNSNKSLGGMVKKNSYLREPIRSKVTCHSCGKRGHYKDQCFRKRNPTDNTTDNGLEQERVRQYILQQLTSEPILAIFDQKLPTEVHTDASSSGYGAVLMQTHGDGNKKVVSYFSRVTQGAEPKYHSYELETLAVVKALQHYRHYLIGITFKIVTDCNALKATERKKDLLPRVARWWIYLQDFNFSIEYRKGVLMGHADYLSRNPPMLQVNNIEKPLNWAQMAQSADSETLGLIERLREGRLDSQRYVCRNDVLYYRYSPTGEESRLLCYIPKGHRLSLLRVFHDEHEHIGADKTYELILKHFWFPSLKQFVRKYTSHCLICISKKRVPRAPCQPIKSWDKTDVPFETVHVDVLGPLPQSNRYKFVLILVDSFTKFCLLYPMYRQDSDELKRVFNCAISLFGTPTLIVCDRGRMFESSSFKSWVSEMGCNVHYITPEMHQSNGQAERYVRTVLNLIRVDSNNKKSTWSNTLCKIQLVLNITKQKSTQYSALYLLMGTNATTPVIRALIRDVAIEHSSPNREAMRELSRNAAKASLDKNRDRQDARENRHRYQPRTFKLNDQVFVIKYSQSTGKLDSGMRGPYRVTKILPGDRYELKLLSGARGKTTQAAAQYMVPWKGEWCPESCAAFFENHEVDNERHEDASRQASTSMGATTSTASNDGHAEESCTISPAAPSRAHSDKDNLSAAEDDARSGEAV